MAILKLHKTVGVRVGPVQVGGGAPVVVQSMTMTDTADAEGTSRQCIELAQAGSDMVRVTVNVPEAAAAVPEIKRRMLDAGVTAPLIGDFHYNGHLLLTRYPECADALDKYRINPGNVGTGRRRDEQFATICGVARDRNKPVRIGVNGGSLNQELVLARMQENTDRDLGLTSEEIINECMVLSALQSTELALESGLRKDQIIISCKTSRPRDLISVYRELARRTDQPLHLGLTEAGMGTKGIVWSSAAMGVLLNEGIGDTIRVSLTPRPGGDRREEVYAACELLQALGIRSFSPSVTACPGCGRTTSSTFQELAERTQDYIRERMPEWKTPARRGRNHDPRGDGVRRERPGRVEGREHRHQPAGHRGSSQLPRLHRWPPPYDASRVRTTSSRWHSASSSITTSRPDIRARRQLRVLRAADRTDQSIRLTSTAPFSYSFLLASPSASSNAGTPFASEPRPSARSDVFDRSSPGSLVRIGSGVAARLRLVLFGVLRHDILQRIAVWSRPFVLFSHDSSCGSMSKPGARSPPHRSRQISGRAGRCGGTRPRVTQCRR